MEGLVVSFLNLLLYIAIVIFIAVCIVWACRWFGISIDPDVYKWGKVIVGLLCLIAVVIWLFGALGGIQIHSPFVYGR